LTGIALNRLKNHTAHRGNSKGAKNVCGNNPCHNNATCQVGFTNRGYRCVCAPGHGFKGQDCRDDEDECTAATHTCDANAVCSNTHGSYNCTCKQGFAGDGHNCTENWIQMTPSTVCFGSRDDTYGSFRIPASGSIITFKLTYLSGSVNCYAPNPDVASNWGCKYPGLTHTMGTHITDSNRNRILPENEQYLMGGLGCGKTYYNLPWATPDSPELIFDHFSAPLSVTTDQEFQVWFIEDLFNCGYGDNSQERTCAEVYGLYV
ncbi:uncharacterized protein LOC144666550, partial [Oculina patagonica]